MSKQTEENKTPDIKPTFPEDATIRYGTPYYNGKYMWVDDEETARRIAAGFQSDGSGRIRKRILYTQYTRGEGWVSSTKIDYEEDLEPVTVFDAEGLKRKQKRDRDLACKHTNISGWKLVAGAGCQKDYEKHCLDCGTTVAWD